MNKLIMRMRKRNATQPPPLGTILPHPRTERIADAHYKVVQAKKEVVYKSLMESLTLKGRRVKLVEIENETRIEIDNRYYAIVKNSLRVIYFELRADGLYYSISHLP